MGDLEKNCGLLRIYELYRKPTNFNALPMKMSVVSNFLKKAINFRSFRLNLKYISSLYLCNKIVKRSVSAFALSSWTIFVGFLFIDEIWKLKVEKILKGSLYLIQSPSPSVKIQIMGRKSCLRCKGKTLLGEGKLSCP